jgi:hypothetical protein
VTDSNFRAGHDHAPWLKPLPSSRAAKAAANQTSSSAALT